MKTLQTVLTERGQVSVPADIRHKMKMQPGCKVMWEAVSETECHIMVAHTLPRSGVQSVRGYARQFRKPKRTSEWMAELRSGEVD